MLEKTYAEVDGKNEKVPGKNETLAGTIENHASDRLSAPDPIAFGPSDGSCVPGVIDAAPGMKTAVASIIAARGRVQSAPAIVIDDTYCAIDGL